MSAGSIHRFDPQSDIFEGEYRLIEETAPGVWLAENLPPREEMVDAMLAIAAQEEVEGWWGVFGMRMEDGSVGGWDEGVLREWERRVSEAGSTFTIRFVSRSKWDGMF